MITWRVCVINFRAWVCLQCDPSPLRIGNQQHFLDRKMKIVITILISFCPGGCLLIEYRPCGTWTLQAYNTCAIFSLRCKLIGLECCIIMNSLNSHSFLVYFLGMCTIVSTQKYHRSERKMYSFSLPVCMQYEISDTTGCGLKKPVCRFCHCQTPQSFLTHECLAATTSGWSSA